MNTKELRKLLKDNGVCAYTYWGKDKLINLAKINHLLPEQEELKPKEEEPEEPEEQENISWQKQKQIRNRLMLSLSMWKLKKLRLSIRFIKLLNIWINPRKP